MRYSFLVKSSNGLKTAHHAGFGIVLRRCGGTEDRPAYEIRVPMGKVKMLFANELTLAPAESVARKLVQDANREIGGPGTTNHESRVTEHGS